MANLYRGANPGCAELSGVLSIFSETEAPLSIEELTLLSSIADHIGLAVENVRLRQQTEQAAVREDRQRLAASCTTPSARACFRPA